MGEFYTFMEPPSSSLKRGKRRPEISALQGYSIFRAVLVKKGFFHGKPGKKTRKDRLKMNF